MSNVPAATRTLRVLRFLARQPEPVPLDRIASACGLPRSTAYHLVAAMEAEGFVTQLREERRYGLGVAAIGREFPPQVTRFLAQARAESDAARALFAALGARLLLARSFVAVDALAKRSGSVEGVNLAPEVAQLLEPGTDLKAKSDSQLALVRGHLARVVRRLTTWARFRRP